MGADHGNGEASFATQRQAGTGATSRRHSDDVQHVRRAQMSESWPCLTFQEWTNGPYNVIELGAAGRTLRMHCVSAALADAERRRLEAREDATHAGLPNTYVKSVFVIEHAEGVVL